MIEQVDHNPRARTFADVCVQRLRQHNRRTGVAAQVFVHRRKTEAGNRVVLKSGGAVDHGIDRAKAGDHLGQQAAHLSLITKISMKCGASARQTSAVSYCF